MNRRRFLVLLGFGPAALAAGGVGTRILGGTDADRAVVQIRDLGPTRALAQPEVQPQQTIYKTFVPGAASTGVPLDARISQGFTWQGGTLKVVATKGAGGNAEVFGRTYPIVAEADGTLGGFIGFGVLDPPGMTVVTAVIDSGDGGPLRTFAFDVEVRQTQWTVDYITLPPPDPNAPPPSQDEIDRQARERERERRLLDETYALVTERKWEGRWIAPLDEIRVTGYFGAQRSFNGGPVGGHHGGTDFGAWLGTPIKAVNHGTVVVAEEVIVRGNMVIIDHGAGVLSGYAHMDQIDVEVGQEVRQGDVVGTVGTTGLSTGYHLHWEMAVRGILVDGLRWLDGTQGF